MRVRGAVLSLLVAAAVVLTAGTAFGGDNPRVFITDSQSWEIGGGGAAVDGTGATAGRGGARPQTAEIVKTFNERCPNVIVNNRRDRADYIVVLDHEGGKSAINRDNKIAVFHNASGDAIYSHSTRSLGNSVKDACAAIYHDASRRAAAENSNRQVEASVAADPNAAPQAISGTANGAHIKVTSSVNGADVEIDGKYVGSTPSSILLKPGDHTVIVRKDGYVPWQRTLTVTDGDINVMAELRKQ